MSVTIASTSGFCWGVRRAVDLVLAELKRGHGPYRVLGPLVHNPQVLRALEERGVEFVPDPSGVSGGTLFLRTHGSTLEERARAGELDVRIRDLTCPRVGRALALARSKRNAGFHILILGDAGHQEVRALRSYAGEESSHVISGPADAALLPELDRPFLISQTTQDTDLFDATVEALRRRFPSLEWENTICESTGMRQAELRQLYPKADCIVVVGGRDSANTSRLSSIARDLGRPVFQVESPDDIDPSSIRGFRRILVTAGASTPSWVIRRVRGRLLELQGATVGRAIGLLGSLVLGNFHIIPAAAALGAAGAFAVGNAGWALPLASASLALFSLHGLNTVMEAGFSTTSGEEREAFVRRHRGLLSAASFAGLAASVALSALLPPLWGGCLALSLFMFVAYSAPLLGVSTLPPGGVRSIPGSRDTLFALAWAFLLSILPAITKGSSGAEAVALWSIQLTMLLLGRSLLLDLVDLQSDAMLGRDTIPLALGAARSRALLWMTVLVPPALLLAGVAVGLLPVPALGAATGHAWLAAGYSRLRRTPFPSELAARLCADGSLFAAGAAPVLMAIAGLG